MLHRITKVFIGGVIGLSLLTQASGVYAASFSGSSLTTTPVSINLTGKPGTSVSTQLSVQNNSNAPTTIKISVEEFSSDGKTGEPYLHKAAPGDTSVDWVTFNENNFVAQPHVVNNVQMTINVPDSASLGYYYAVVFTPSVSVAKLNTPNAKYIGSNAILVLLDTESGNENKSMQISQFSTNHSIFQYLPVNFNVTVANTGNIHLIPTGDIYISRTSSGPSIVSLPVNYNDGNVLPYSKRTFTATWNKGFPLYQTARHNGVIVSNKNGTPKQELTWNFSNLSEFRFGEYYAHLVMVYPGNGRDIPIDAVVSFWVIPWTLIVIALVILILIGIGIYSILRTTYKPLKRRQQAKHHTPKA